MNFAIFTIDFRLLQGNSDCVSFIASWLFENQKNKEKGEKQMALKKVGNMRTVKITLEVWEIEALRLVGRRTKRSAKKVLREAIGEYLERNKGFITDREMEQLVAQGI